jgi:two-component system, OmpR family, sensor kinase
MRINAQLDEQIFFPAFTAVITQADGTYRVLTPPRNWLEQWQWRLLLGMALTAALIAPLAFVLSRRLSAPMVALARGAAEIEFGPQAPPVQVSGPREVRAAADALNAMQVRLKTYVDNRTALITAIAHDLKTPLARLRLRAETLPSPHRATFHGDIGHMDALINSALNFAAADRRSLQLTPLDMSSLIESMCEDMADLHPVTLGQIDTGLTVSGDATALKRILTNLIENAMRYGGDAEVVAHTAGDKPEFIEIIIRDNGPGLPEGSLEAVFEPFFRLETSRNRDTGGVGLGLSLARKLTEAHDGTLLLRNRIKDGETVGLEAVLRLPKWVRA